MQVVRVTCDVCQAPKLESNHWWMAWSGVNGIFIVPWGSFEIEECVKVLCGQGCAMTLLQQFMATGAIETMR